MVENRTKCLLGKKSKRANSIRLEDEFLYSIIHRSISRGRVCRAHKYAPASRPGRNLCLVALLSALIDRFESHGSRRPFEFQMREIAGSNMTILVAVFSRLGAKARKGRREVRKWLTQQVSEWTIERYRRTCGNFRKPISPTCKSSSTAARLDCWSEIVQSQ